MAKLNLTPKTALIIFISVVVVLFAQAVWWVAFMAQLTDEKVEMATELGADQQYIAEIQKQETKRQIMLGSEGLFFLTLVLIGAWLIYRSLVKAEELKFHQQNFLMAVTHELKTPMASIKIYLGSLESPRITDEKKLEIIPRVKDDLARLEKLVDNILDAGRFERAGFHLDRADFNLTTLVNKLLDDLDMVATIVPLDLKRKIDTDIIFDGDPKALGRAIGGILENSLKYNEKEKIVLNIALKKHGKLIELTITDNGMGFDTNDASAIFNRFYRLGAELSRSKPGSGLGLYLAREIVKAHGGKIAAHSDGPGKGATFTITLKDNGKNKINSTG